MGSDSSSDLFPSAIPINISTSLHPPITIHALHSNPPRPLPPLLLLHGFPQTHHIWRKIYPLLTPHYHLILPDLRGYGSSSKPRALSPTDHSLMAKSALARDCAALMQHLNFPSYHVAGHDRGARVAHKLAVDHPDRVRRLMLLDVCPTKATYEQADAKFATAYWHWFFLIQPSPLPEAAIAGAPDAFAGWMLRVPAGDGGRRVEVFGEQSLPVYEGLFRDNAGVHAMCEDYRAAAQEDVEEQRGDEEHGRVVRCPTEVIWGAKGVVGKMFDAVRDWRRVCAEGCLDEGACGALDCGHYIPEERPVELAERIKAFFRE